MIFFSLFFAIFSYSQQVADVVISTESIAEKRIYKPLNHRNPMVRPITTSPTTLKYSYTLSTSNLSGSFDIERVVLEGIMSTAFFKEALLRDTLTGEMYIVREGKIYTISRKVIEGYHVKIVGKGVIISEIKTGKKKELILSDKGDGI